MMDETTKSRIIQRYKESTNDHFVHLGNLCGQKAQFPDGIDYSIWYPSEEDDSTGVIIDFSEEDIDDVIALLQYLKECSPHFVFSGNQ